jgi:hypothetical protein
LPAVAERRGLSYQKPRPKAAEAKQEALHDEVKMRRKMHPTVVCIDQIKKSVQVKPLAAWFPRVTPPSVELSGQRD